MSQPDLHRDVDWSKCHWVVFDAVGTLIHPTPSVSVAYHSIASGHGSQLTVTEIGDRFRRAFRQSERQSFENGSAVGSHWFSNDAIELARWRWIVNEVIPDVDDREACFVDLWEHFARPGSWSCFDDVGPALAQLKQAGYRLAIASNFDSRLHAVCDSHAALSAIERRFVSSQTGFRKPAPDFYSTVVAQCGRRADEILMIGDDPEHDVAGPIAAGMQAVLLDRKSANPREKSIASLGELRPEIRCQPNA